MKYNLINKWPELQVVFSFVCQRAKEKVVSTESNTMNSLSLLNDFGHSLYSFVAFLDSFLYLHIDLIIQQFWSLPLILDYSYYYVLSSECSLLLLSEPYIKYLHQMAAETVKDIKTNSNNYLLICISILACIGQLFASTCVISFFHPTLSGNIMKSS